MAVHQGRLTTDLPAEGAVLFLIGMRINRLWQVWKWFPVFIAMPRMLAELMRNPTLGLRGRPRTFMSGRTILVWQQWESFETLESYSRASEHLHLPAWRSFNRRTRDNASVGIYHETYLLSPGTVEAMYVNMPAFGLGAAFGTRAPDSRSNTATQRLNWVPSEAESTQTGEVSAT